MSIYSFQSEQFLAQPLERVFDFFKKPENLDSVTPKNLGFKILTPSPILMKKGAEIDYTIQLYGFPMRWKTVITDYDPPHSFTDSQVKGPYKSWVHTHRFASQGAGTRMSDDLKYEIPLGPLGCLAHFLFVKREVEKIFEYRKQVIDQLFLKGVS